MALQSQLFRGDPKLEAAAVSDPAHIVPGAKGPHVGKIQQALIQLDGAAIDQDSAYGPATAAAVSAFKTKRRILNFAGKIDDIVGKKTMAALDAEMLAKEQGGGGRGGRLGIVEPIGRNARNHMLIFFTGDVDQKGRGGLPMDPSDRKNQEFLVEVDLVRVVSPAVLAETSFNGSGTNKIGVRLAAAAILALPGLLGKLIIYGFSAGAVNGLDLCRDLQGFAPELRVDLLITVDLVNGTRPVDPTVPDNVLLNRNYFQIHGQAKTRLNLNGRPTVGRGVQNVPCNNRKFSTLSTPHGQMPGLTSKDAAADVRGVINAK